MRRGSGPLCLWVRRSWVGCLRAATKPRGALSLRLRAQTLSRTGRGGRRSSGVTCAHLRAVGPGGAGMGLGQGRTAGTQ